MKRLLAMTVLLVMAGCGGEDLEWMSMAADDIAREQAASATAKGAPNREADAVAAAEPVAEPDGAAAERRVVFVDVRRPDEFAAGHVEDAILIPHTELAERVSELEEYRDADIVLYCRTGRRSGIAEQILRQAGFEHLHNGGGLTDLERQGVPITH